MYSRSLIRRLAFVGSVPAPGRGRRVEVIFDLRSERAWGWSHGRPTVSHGLFSRKTDQERVVGHTAYDKAHAKNNGGSFICRIVECSWLQPPFRDEKVSFFAVMQASFTVEKHFVTDTLAVIELRAPPPESTTETDKKNLYPLYTVLTVSDRLSDGLLTN